ncbi:MAG: alpha-glucan family phosphorylase [Candidatus Woesearchaeota archaeon]
MDSYENRHIAYFSMEIGLDFDIPTYSGGLGVLAGDTLKSCADLKVPIVGVTLLYKKGYFKQKIDDNGNQLEEDEDFNYKDEFTELPNTVTINIEGREVKLKGWYYKVFGISGFEVPIVFLDSDLLENSDYDKQITQKLYANDRRYRFAQEIILGIGGVRMLLANGFINIQKYHMNEGHSSLLTLEVAKNLNDLEKENFLKNTRKKCVFTTHTPVPAGHDSFDKSLVENMLGEYLEDKFKEVIFKDSMLNMTYLGLIFSKFINGVAKQHSEVSRNMFPGYYIESITNGIHSNFWTAQPFKDLFDLKLSGWRSDPFCLRYALGISKDEILDAHMKTKKELIDFVNQKYNLEMKNDVFTIGFARRAATYKRGDLLFYDINRLIEIGSKYDGIQIIYGGKAHPSDTQGKEVIKKIIDHMKQVKDKIKVCYIENYNIEIAKLLTSGVDIWLNTPMRPKEASGTSGMKASHNAIPHFSVLDGWWLEGHIEGITGWSIGPHPKKCLENSNEIDSKDLYDKLENLILPKFYENKKEWVDIMRHSIAINASFFNTHRMVQQYVINAYFS